MPVNTPHADYSYRKPDWDRIRTFREGARAVRAAGETFLPKPTGWKDEEYASYKARAEVYGAIDRTIDGLDGAIFRKAPTSELPQKDSAIETDITLAGQTMIEFARKVEQEVVTVGRVGVLVDFTGAAPMAAQTATEQAAAVGIQRPYAVIYAAEQIINWEVETIGGETKTTLVVLEEREQIPSTDPFVRDMRLRYRVLRLVDRAYTVEIWTPKQDATTAKNTATKVEVAYEKTQEYRPMRRGKPLDRIPFFFLAPGGQSPTPEKPPLLDIADLCVLHYQASADLAHGLHWVALPTPWVTGARDKDQMKIGPSAAIILEDSEARVGMLEFTGAGLQSIESRMQGLERKMAALGARILEEQKKDSESGEALKLRQSGDASVLAGISDAVSRAIEAILARMFWWDGTEANEPEVTFSLNMDFFAQAMDPQMLVALMQARQSGEISRETFLWNLQRGEMLAEGRTIEDELGAIDTDPPPNMGKGAVGGGQGGDA